MPKPLLLFLLFLASSWGTKLSAQDFNHWALDLNVGTEFGWWVHQKGTSPGGSFKDLGEDYTHHSVFLSFGVKPYYRHDHFNIGLGLSYAFLLEDDMIGREDRLFRVQRIPIAQNSVKFWQYSIWAEYHLIQLKNYHFSPNLALGGFSIESIHPERDNFGSKFQFQFGLNQEFLFDWGSLYFRPSYTSMQIQPKEARNQDEKHRIYSLGVQSGIRIWLF